MRPETEEAAGAATATAHEATMQEATEPAHAETVGTAGTDTAAHGEHADSAGDEPPAVPMNRAERRARESGRKTNTEPSGFMAQLRDPGGHGPGGRNAFGRGKVRFPRTGHK